MKFNQKEAIRYLGGKKGDQATEILVDTVYLKLRNEVQARSVWQKYSCHVEADRVVLDGRVELLSADLARHLRDCKEVIVFAATLGIKVDSAIRRIALTSVAEGAAAQAVAAALIESYCDEQQEQIDTGSLHQRPRFSPGYGDWDLAEQRKLFNLLDCSKKIGLTLTDGMMMVPTKSVTAVIGIAEDAVCVWNKCMTCKNINCPFREEI